MKKATLQFDEHMTAYVEYAAAIEGTPVKTFLAKLRRKFNALHSSLKRLYTVQTFADKTVCDVIASHEAQNGLLKSYTYSRSTRAARRCWENMLRNRAALAV
jgi:hypothetical protein